LARWRSQSCNAPADESCDEEDGGHGRGVSARGRLWRSAPANRESVGSVPGEQGRVPTWQRKVLRARRRFRSRAPPEKVYAMLSDVTRMGEWSPGVRQRPSGVGGATGPRGRAHGFKGPQTKLNWPDPVVEHADGEGGRSGQGVHVRDRQGRARSKHAGRTGSRPRTAARSSRSRSRHSPTARFQKLTNKPETRTAKLTGDIQQTLERIKQAAEGSA